MSIQVRSNEKPPETPPAAAAVADSPVNNAAPKEAPVDQSKDQAPLSAQDPNASLQNQASDSEPEGTKAPAKEGEPKEDQDDEGKEPGKKKGGFQRRIDKLSAQKAQAERELDYWKGMALKNAGVSNTGQPPKTEPATTQPSNEGKPKPEDFDSHTEYVESLTDWKTEQKLKERENRSEKERLNQEQNKIVSTYTDRMKAFSEKTADFQDVVSEVDHIPLSPALREIILTSDNGPQLAYELAKNPGEYERIAKLPPLACAREMGRFETRLNSSSLKGAASTEKKITQAPRPIDPVGTGKGSVGKSIFDSNLSQLEYEALRKEQMKQRRRA